MNLFRLRPRRPGIPTNPDRARRPRHAARPRNAALEGRQLVSYIAFGTPCGTAERADCRIIVARSRARPNQDPPVASLRDQDV